MRSIYLTFRLCLLFLLSLASAQVNTLGLLRESGEGISGNVGLNIDGARGNSNYLKYGANARIDFLASSTQHFIVGDYQIGQSGSNFETYLRKGFVHARSIWRTGLWLSPEGFAQGEINDGLQLRYRDLAGLGLRIGPSKISKDSLRLALGGGSGLMYEIENYRESKQAPLRTHYFERWRASNYLSLELRIQPQLLFSIGGYYQPNLANPDDFRFLVNSKLSLQIWKNLKFSQKFNTRFDSEPYDPNLERWDWDLGSGLELGF